MNSGEAQVVLSMQRQKKRAELLKIVRPNPYRQIGYTALLLVTICASFLMDWNSPMLAFGLIFVFAIGVTGDLIDAHRRINALVELLDMSGNLAPVK